MKIAPHHIFMFLTFLYISVLSNTAIAESLGILQTELK